MKNFEIMSKAQYEAHMTHVNAAANAFAKILEYAAKVDAEKLSCMNELSKLAADKNVSEAFRAKRSQEVRQNALRGLEACWLVVEKLFPALGEELAAITEHLDLNDNRLTAAVRLMTAAGAQKTGVGSMPSAAVENALVQPFAGNYEALMMLRGLADSVGLGGAVSKIDEHIKIIEKAQQFVGMAEHFMYQGTRDPEGDFVQFDIAPYAKAVESVYGFATTEIPEGLMLAATRRAMGLPVGFPDGFTMEGAKVDGKPVYTVTGEPV